MSEQSIEMLACAITIVISFAVGHLMGDLHGYARRRLEEQNHNHKDQKDN